MGLLACRLYETEEQQSPVERMREGWAEEEGEQSHSQDGSSVQLK
jgi:hypothetical protein